MTERSSKPPAGAGGSLHLAELPVDRPRRDPEELRGRIKTQLSSFKVPRRLVVMRADEMPRTVSSKIRKPALIPILIPILILFGQRLQKPFREGLAEWSPKPLSELSRSHRLQRRELD